MHRNHRALAAIFAFLAVLAAALPAEESLCANDLEAAQLASVFASGGFTILATAEKGVTVEAIEPRVAADGEVFNMRVKLNGAGGPGFRAVKFAAAAGAELRVYLNSSSGTDARVLKVVDLSGAVVAELAAPADDKANAGLAVATLPNAGEYLVFSAGSGINIYQIIVK